ncbi:MAG: YitT family protein [Eubacteriales bacterium]|nr:YitT family protein [Eubacteriales bacterium]
MSLIRKFGNTRVFRYLAIALFAVAYALIYEIFVFPNSFAPAGINGIVTMIQYLFRFKVGYLSLIINLPMLAVAWFVLDRSYALRTLTFTLIFSGTLLVSERLGIAESGIIFEATDTGGRLLAAIAAGLFNGFLYSMSVRMGGSTGGTDVVGEFIHHARPEYNTVWVIFTINAIVAVASFFVYDLKYEPVILCAVYIFVNSRTSDAIFKGNRAAAKFEVITTQPEQLSHELITTLRHGCTVIRAEGMYTHSNRAMLVCVINRRQVVDFERIIRKYDNTFAYISTVNGIVGNFKKIK